jgi:hypothetical protein
MIDELFEKLEDFFDEIKDSIKEKLKTIRSYLSDSFRYKKVKERKPENLFDTDSEESDDPRLL